MLRINLSIPVLRKVVPKFNSYFVTSGSLYSTKYYEIQISYSNNYWVEMDLDVSIIGKDHAGIELTLGAFGYTISFMLYDSRHWDYENNTWMSYDREENEENST